MEELWTSIRGYSDRYEVSNLGRVRRRDTGATLKAVASAQRRKHGDYLHVDLYRPGAGRGGQVKHLVHKLVLEYFVGPQPEGTISGHLDGDPANNVWTNLAWISHKENARHRTAHGRAGRNRGERQGSAKLTETDVAEIRSLLAESGLSQVEIGGLYGVKQMCISNIFRRVTWKHVP